MSGPVTPRQRARNRVFLSEILDHKAWPVVAPCGRSRVQRIEEYIDGFTDAELFEETGIDPTGGELARW